MSKEGLIAELAATRVAIAKDYRAVRYEMDVAEKIKRVVRQRPFAWLGGAAALGWILSGPKTKKKLVTKYVAAQDKRVGKTEKKSGGRFGGLIAVFFTVARFALPYLKPALLNYATQYMSDRVGKQGR